MPEDDPKLPPLPPGVPRPPSQADIDRVSGQQGLIADEWAGEDPPPAERPLEPPVEPPGAPAPPASPPATSATDRPDD